MLKSERRKQKTQRYKVNRLKEKHDLNFNRVVRMNWNLEINKIKQYRIRKILEDTIERLRSTVSRLESELSKNPNLSRILNMLSVHKNRQTGQTTLFMTMASENDLLIVRSQDEVRRLENIGKRQGKKRNIVSIDSDLHHFAGRFYDRIFWDIN